MFIGYNLSRCITILGAEKLIKALRKSCHPDFLTKIMFILSRFNGFFIQSLLVLTVQMEIFNTRESFLFDPKELYLYEN